MSRKYNLFGIFVRTDNIIQRLTFDLDHKNSAYINDENSRHQCPDISPRYVTTDSIWSSEYADLTITTKVDPPIAEVSCARFIFLK